MWSRFLIQISKKLSREHTCMQETSEDLSKYGRLTKLYKKGMHFSLSDLRGINPHIILEGRMKKMQKVMSSFG